MKLHNYKKASSAIFFLFTSVTAMAHPGHNDVAAAHGDGIGVWLVHQLLGVDQLLTVAILALFVALTGGRLFRGDRFRRRSRD